MKSKSLLLNKKSLVLSPMVRLNTLPFRLLCLNHGADLVFSEEIISYKLLNCIRVENEKLDTIDFVQKKNNDCVLRISKQDKGKLIVQLGANNEEVALKAAKLIENDVIGIDVNMGCPKHFSTHGNMGSNLLYLPELACGILEKLKKNINKNLLLSCKVRLLEDNNETIDFINKVISCGIDFFTVHFRTKFQTAKDKAQWEKIEIIWKNCRIGKEVFFYVNGDVFTYNDYKAIIDCKYNI